MPRNNVSADAAIELLKQAAESGLPPTLADKELDKLEKELDDAANVTNVSADDEADDKETDKNVLAANVKYPKWSAAKHRNPFDCRFRNGMFRGRMSYDIEADDFAPIGQSVSVTKEDGTIVYNVIGPDGARYSPKWQTKKQLGSMYPIRNMIQKEINRIVPNDAIEKVLKSDLDAADTAGSIVGRWMRMTAGRRTDMGTHTADDYKRAAVFVHKGLEYDLEDINGLRDYYKLDAVTQEDMDKESALYADADDDDATAGLETAETANA